MDQITQQAEAIFKILCNLDIKQKEIKQRKKYKKRGTTLWN